MYETLLGETYAVTTLEEVLLAREERDKARERYNNRYKDYLITCLCDTGLVNKVVRAKTIDTTGVLRVEEKSYSTLHPFEIKFYPHKKNGELSVKPKYISSFWSLELKKLHTNLRANFEVVGDENAS